MQPNGEYIDERKELHAQIIDLMLTPDAIDATKPADGVAPTVTLLGGRGGSGKSWFTGANGPVDGEHAIMINADDIQEHLPGYAGWNAGHYHDEAADIGKEVEDRCRSLGLNVVLDATMRSSASTIRKVDVYSKSGYKVNGYYMFASPETAAKRAVGRFISKNRYVPVSYILGSVSNEKTFDSLKGQFSKWGVYDNNAAGGKPKLIAKGSNDA
jgi:predicted kinase